MRVEALLNEIFIIEEAYGEDIEETISRLNIKE